MYFSGTLEFIEASDPTRLLVRGRDALKSQIHKDHLLGKTVPFSRCAIEPATVLCSESTVQYPHYTILFRRYPSAIDCIIMPERVSSAAVAGILALTVVAVVTLVFTRRSRVKNKDLPSAEIKGKDGKRDLRSSSPVASAADAEPADDEEEEADDLLAALHPLLSDVERPTWENPLLLGFNKQRARPTLGAFSSIAQARCAVSTVRQDCGTAVLAYKNIVIAVAVVGCRLSGRCKISCCPVHVEPDPGANRLDAWCANNKNNILTTHLPCALVSFCLP